MEICKYLIPSFLPVSYLLVHSNFVRVKSAHRRVKYITVIIYYNLLYSIIIVIYLFKLIDLRDIITRCLLHVAVRQSQ